MEVTKRNGKKEPVYFDKITQRLKNLIDEGNLKYVDPVIVAQKVIQNLYNGITTLELDDLSTRVCASLSSDEPNYGLLGGRICISNLQKMTRTTFFETCQKLMNNLDRNGEPSPLLTEKFFKIIEKNKDIIESKIDYSRDFQIDLFGFKTLERSYLMKSNEVIVERPQHLWMRVSIGIHEDDLVSAFETYELMSQKYFTHASPTLFNAATRRPQLSSCFLMGTEDSIEGIFKTISNCAYISKNAGGIGVHLSNIRADGSLIRKTNGISNGIIPMLQVYNYVARYIDQGGKRPGSFAMYLEPWHSDVFEFLDLRKNTGLETERARDLFLGLWIPDLFMKKVETDDYWYLMCPDECKGLPDVWGDSFEQLYNSYVDENRYRKKIKARLLWNKIIESQVETGAPYILYKDHVNRKSNQQNIGTIKSSNLCAEIVEYSDEKETAVCNLVSIALNKYVRLPELNCNIKLYTKSDCKYCKLAKMLLKNYNIEYDEVNLDDDDDRKLFFEELNNCVNGNTKTVPQIFLNDKRIGGYDELKVYLQPTYDFDKLKEIAKIACKNLNKVIDINYYPIPEAKLSNLKHRPIGIGVQGLADTYFLMRYAFDSEEAHNLNKLIFETIYFGALEASMELSKERGERMQHLIDVNISEDEKIKLNDKLKYSADGSYDHFEMDLKRTKALGSYHTFIGSPLSKGKFQFDLWNVNPSDRWDWSSLRENIVVHGVRNSLVTALMPTASTSQILGNNECFEPITSNIYKRKTQAGEFKLINKYLIRDLKNLGQWNQIMKESIIYHNGSVQQLKIPTELKELYKTNWELKQKHIVIQAAERGPFIDQTQSMNIYMADAKPDRITSCHFASWKLGLKTGIYYFRTKPGANAIKFTINERNIQNEPDCLSCSA